MIYDIAANEAKIQFSTVICLLIHLSAGRVVVSQTYIPEETLETQIKNVKNGGRWEPETCTSRYKVAIIVPYRDRPKEKSYFLQHMHPFLQRQLLCYRVFIVEQVSI